MKCNLTQLLKRIFESCILFGTFWLNVPTGIIYNTSFRIFLNSIRPESFCWLTKAQQRNTQNFSLVVDF